jgi:hypothetical protein
VFLKVTAWGNPLKFSLLIGIFGILSVTAFSQTPSPAAPAAINEAYLAKDDGTGHAGDRATSFGPNDIPIYCVIQLESAVPTTVKMNLIAESVPGVKPETKVVATSYTTKDGENRVNFNGRPLGKWVPGLYRAEIFIDGKLAKNLSFEIKGQAASPTAARPFVPNKQEPKKPVAAKPKKRSNAPFTATAVYH